MPSEITMPVWFLGMRDVLGIVGVGLLVFFVGRGVEAIRSLTRTVHEHTHLDEQRFGDVHREIAGHGERLGRVEERVGMVKQAVADVESELERST